MCLAHDIMDYTGVCLLELTDQIHRLLVCFKLFMNHKAIYDSSKVLKSFNKQQQQQI